MKISPRFSIALACLALWACEEAAAPEGQLGDITVAVYVDNDASGSLTSGDFPLVDFPVALFRGTQQLSSARTAADGRVTFNDLEPGSYRLEVTEQAPSGSTLATNPSPSAVIDFRGRPVSVEFRYVRFPGIIGGRVFRDENGNGTFEQGTDVPGPGIWVFLRADTGDVGAKLDSVRTDSLGAYRFVLVPPGGYYLEFERLGAINYGAGGATRHVGVIGAFTTIEDVLFTGSIFVTVRQARATPVDSTVAVVADVTAPAGVFTSGTGGVNSEIWVQDTTGGIAAFPVPTADSATLRLGTRIEVVGPITLFSGQRQIGRAGSAPTIRVRTGGSVVAPKSNTAAQARALTDEGRLITVPGLRVVTVPTGTGAAFTVTTVSSTDDTLQIRVAGTATGLTRSSFIVGERYNITGILTQFNGTAQVKPRFATDVAQIVVTPVARIIINEIMANPSATNDAGEYLEIYNWGTAPADLQNWKLFGNSLGDTARITTSLIVPAGGYVLLGNNANTATNGGLVLDYAYTVFNMNNTGDRIVLKDAAGATVDSVAYTTAPPTNASRGVRDASADNTDVGGANWQTSTTAYNAVDLGTPKAQNDGYITPTPPAPLVLGETVAPSTKKLR
jgi:DNA/RNA endonuclease YhcR with UshA esterase domain/uncharacterized protein (DUF2141 family)